MMARRAVVSCGCFCVGEFYNAPLGNVYAEDEDDWDVENKTFAFVDGKHDKYFKYASHAGLVTISANNNYVSYLKACRK